MNRQGSKVRRLPARRVSQSRTKRQARPPRQARHGRTETWTLAQPSCITPIRAERLPDLEAIARGRKCRVARPREATRQTRPAPQIARAGTKHGPGQVFRLRGATDY